MSMRIMQAEADEKRDAQYLLIKSPPAAGKPRAQMFIALATLRRQSAGKAVLCEPPGSSG